MAHHADPGLTMTRPRQRGFTLIELIIFIVVVGATSP